MQRARAQFRRGLLQAGHDPQHIDARLALGVDRDGRRAPGQHKALFVGPAFLDRGHIAQIDRSARAPFQDHPAQITRLIFAGEAQAVFTLAHIGETAGDIRAGAGQLHHPIELHAEARHLVGIKGDPELPLAAAIDLRAGHARHALKTRLHDLFNIIFVGLDRSFIARRGLDDEPGDGPRVLPDRRDRRLGGVSGIIGDLIEPVHHLDQGAPHVHIDREAQIDLGPPLKGLRANLGQARQAAQHIFLDLDDLGLHLIGRGRAPVGGDRDLRLLDLGGKLDGQARQADQAEDQDQRQRDQQGHGIGQPRAGDDHRRPPLMIRTGWPGRRRSLPRVTIRSFSLTPPMTSIWLALETPVSTGINSAMLSALTR